MIAKSLYLRSNSYNPFVQLSSSSTRIHTSGRHFSSGSPTMLSRTPRKFENFTRPLYYNGYSPLLTHLSIVQKTSLTGIFPTPHPIITLRRSGFRFPSIYGKAHALSHRLVVVYILYIHTQVLSNVFSLCHSFFIPFSLQINFEQQKTKKDQWFRNGLVTDVSYFNPSSENKENSFFSLLIYSQNPFSLSPLSLTAFSSTDRPQGLLYTTQHVNAQIYIILLITYYISERTLGHQRFVNTKRRVQGQLSRFKTEYTDGEKGTMSLLPP